MDTHKFWVCVPCIFHWFYTWKLQCKGPAFIKISSKGEGQEVLMYVLLWGQGGAWRMCYYEGREAFNVCGTMRAGGGFDVCATMRAGGRLTYVLLWGQGGISCMCYYEGREHLTYVLLLNLLLVCHTVVHFEFGRSTLPLPTNTEVMLQWLHFIAYHELSYYCQTSLL